MVRRLTVLSLAASALALPAAPASAATCEGADTSIAEASAAAARASVLCIVNAERVARGLPVLTRDAELELAAQRHTDDMVARDFFAHVAPEGTDPGDRIAAAGYDWWAYGENIAAGQRTPRQVMAGWMKSPGHCRNVLEPGFTELGVGTATAAATISPGTGTWTQAFGRPAGTQAPSDDEGPQNACSPLTVLLGLDNPAVALPDLEDLPGAGRRNGTAADGGRATGTGTGQAGADTDPTTTPLSLRLRRVARRLTISGRLPAADSTPVQITVRRAGRTVFRTTLRLRDGRYRLRLAIPRRAGRLSVEARAAGQRAKRSNR